MLQEDSEPSSRKSKSVFTRMLAGEQHYQPPTAPDSAMNHSQVSGRPQWL